MIYIWPKKTFQPYWHFLFLTTVFLYQIQSEENDHSKLCVVYWDSVRWLMLGLVCLEKEAAEKQ